MQIIERRGQFEGLAVGRFAERPEARFIAQNSQPGEILGAGLWVGLQKHRQTVDGFGTAVHVAQGPHQRQLGLPGFRESGGCQAGDLEGYVRVSAIEVRPGHLQAYGNVVGVGGQLLAQHTQLVIAVAGVDGVVNLAVPDAPRRGRGFGNLGVLDARGHQESQRRQPESSRHDLSIASSSPTWVPLCSTVPAGSSSTE